MPTFLVTCCEYRTYRVVYAVEADDADEAKALVAEDGHGDQVDDEFIDVTGLEVVGVEEES